MIWVKLFDEFENNKNSTFNHRSENRGVYHFDDSFGNRYKVTFHGPHDDLDDIKTGITYDLDFFTQDEDYKKLSGAGIPFSISNFIFDDILKDFISKNQVDTICIFSTDAPESTPRYDKKISTKHKLYLRTLQRKFNLRNWEIVNVEKQLPERDNIIVLINHNSNFWKENPNNLEKIKKGE
jgi:hypothetical protein